jgi:hypothetical protein
MPNLDGGCDRCDRGRCSPTADLKGEYKAARSDPIMIDFWLVEYELKDERRSSIGSLFVGRRNAAIHHKWGPVWLSGWTAGKPH